MDNKWIVGVKPQYNMTPDEALNAFINNTQPFNTPQIKRIADTYKVILRNAFLMEKECESLIQVPHLETKTLASLHVLKETFVVSQEMSRFQETCFCFINGFITVADLDSEVVSIAANVLAMGYIAHFATKGMATSFEDTDYGHELFAVSAQRIDALSDDLTMALSRVSLIAVLCGITPN